MSGVFSAKLYCKMCDLFCYFLLASKRSAGKSEILKNSDDVHWNVSTYIKTLHVRNSILEKRIPIYEVFNHLYFAPNFVF